MSYDETNPWESEIKEGIESVLKGKAQIKYVYLNTKYNYPQGSEYARKAYALYQGFRPDGVIAADDDAQSLFVVPYLKNRVKTPVMFCGVNSEAGQYGYPAENVSGILERSHISESIALLQQLVPSVKKVAYITPDDSMGKIHKRQIEREAASYSAKSLPVRQVKNLDEAVSVTKELKSRSDALILLSMVSLRDSANNQPAYKHIFQTLSEHYGKPIISVGDFEIRHGLLCAVVKSGREQGATASKMLLRAMTGTPLSQIPITTNNEGKRMINVTVMKSLGIKPRPIVLRGTELVKTEE
ncbi:MAG: ABC transporter substrate-binding protein [Desulfuromonadales bacterium]|nr:ABC transporter substrate-binding protein [Desulfuromonadales bacterium]